VSSWRTAPDRFQGGLAEGLPHATQTRLGMYSQKPIEASIVPGKHPQRLTIVGDVQIERFALDVRVVRTLDTATQVDDDLRDDAKAFAAEDQSAIQQALEWPPNLATTSGGTATDCKSLIYDRTRAQIITNKAGEAKAIASVHSFTGTAISRPATT
jgi:hypothetical protein